MRNKELDVASAELSFDARQRDFARLNTTSSILTGWEEPPGSKRNNNLFRENGLGRQASFFLDRALRKTSTRAPQRLNGRLIVQHFLRASTTKGTKVHEGNLETLVSFVVDALFSERRKTEPPEDTSFSRACPVAHINPFATTG